MEAQGRTRLTSSKKAICEGWKHKDLQDLQAPKRPFVLYSIYV